MTKTETLNTWPMKGQPHTCEWRDLKELDGVHRSYLASYCHLCGITMID